MGCSSMRPPAGWAERGRHHWARPLTVPLQATLIFVGVAGVLMVCAMMPLLLTDAYSQVS